MKNKIDLWSAVFNVETGRLTDQPTSRLYTIILLFLSFNVPAQNMMTKIVYPETRKDASVIDDYFGTKVADPYRWLENDNSNETKDWVKRENALTFAYLEKLPLRNVLKERIEKMWNYEKFSAPFKEGGKYYFFKNSGLQNQSVLYVQDFLDVNVYNSGVISVDYLGYTPNY